MSGPVSSYVPLKLPSTLASEEPSRKSDPKTAIGTFLSFSPRPEAECDSVSTLPETDAVTSLSEELKLRLSVDAMREQPLSDPALVPLVNTGGAAPGRGRTRPLANRILNRR